MLAVSNALTRSAEARFPPSQAEIAKFRHEGGEFLKERFAQSLPPGTVNKIHVRYPLPHAKGVENSSPDVMPRINSLLAKHPELTYPEAIARATAEVEAEIESMQNFGPHALEKLESGGTMEVIFWEKEIGGEIKQLTHHTYMDPSTGERFQLEIVAGPAPIARDPNLGGWGVPEYVKTVSELTVKKVVKR